MDLSTEAREDRIKTAELILYQPEHRSGQFLHGQPYATADHRDFNSLIVGDEGFYERRRRYGTGGYDKIVLCNVLSNDTLKLVKAFKMIHGTSVIRPARQIKDTNG